MIKEKNRVNKVPPTPATVIPDEVWKSFLIDIPEREYKFHPRRKWRIDFAWPEWKVAVEIMGGTKSKGRHVRQGGYEKDCEKLNALTVAGWRVLYYLPGKVNYRQIRGLMCPV